MTEPSDEPRGAGAPGSDELLRLMIESATDFAIFSLDPDRRVTSWNVGAERLLGYSEHEIIGRSGDVIFTPEDRAVGIPEQELRDALTKGRAEDERWTLRKNGSRFFASGLMMPLADSRLGFVKIFRDRTEHHRAEARIRQSEARFRLLATNIPQLVFRTRHDGWRTWGSPQWIDFTGLSLKESLGLGWIDAIHPEDRERTLKAWPEAANQREYYVEHRVRRSSDGEFRWHQTRARPVDEDEADDGTDWVGTMTDIHDLRGLQDRQQVLVAELQHRTRNLLAVVMAIARQTRRRSDSLESFGVEFESRLGALGRVQSLLARFNNRDVDLHELVASELGAHHEADREGGRTQVEGPPAALPGSAAQALGLALHELATNAVKHGAFGQQSGRVSVTWREETDEGERWLILEWRERGVLMPPDAEPRRKGYGSELIERALPYQLGARTELKYGADGIRCTIAVPLKGTAKEAEHV